MKIKTTRRNFLKFGIGAGIAALVSSYPFFIERYWVQLNTYRIPVPHLPRNFENFTIVQLTDFHYGFLMPLGIVKKIIHKANSLKKDAVVCTGDYVHERNSLAQIDAIWPQLAKLQAPGGVYSILGNHDHWGNLSRSIYWLNRSGQNTRHKAIPVSIGSEKIWIGGAGDYWEDEVGIDKAFGTVPEQDCKVLLAHNPDTVDTNFNTRVDLVISGHTHGGQVSIPFIGPPILPVNNKLYSSGLVKTRKTNLYISRGLGWSILPIRFNCYPEISILKLQREV